MAGPALAKFLKKIINWRSDTATRGFFQDGAYGRDGLLYLQKMMPIGRAVFGLPLSGASLEGLES